MVLVIVTVLQFYICSVSSFPLYDEEPGGDSPCLCSDTVCLCESRQNINDDFDTSKTNLLITGILFKKKSNFVDLVYESGQNKRALGPATNLLRLGNYRIDYSQVDPQLRKLLVAEKKQNTNSFYNLLRLYDMIIFNN